MVQGFCPLEVEITQFHDGFRRKTFHTLLILLIFFFTSFVHFKSFYTPLFYCIQLNFLILFPVTLDMYFYLMNNKDTSLFMPYVGSVCYWFSPLL